VKENWNFCRTTWSLRMKLMTWHLLLEKYGVQIMGQSNFLYNASSSELLLTWRVNLDASCRNGHHSLMTPERVLSEHINKDFIFYFYFWLTIW